MNYYVLPNELYHHGIKGQRWGIRRFQNPDGTLTEAGKRRYGTIENFNARKTLKKIQNEEKEKQKAITSGDSKQVMKYSSKLSSKELDEAIKRIEYSNKLSNLKTEQVAAGKAKLAEIVAVGTTVKNAMSTVSDIYNASAKIYNAFDKSGKKLPIIGEAKAKLDWEGFTKHIKYNKEAKDQYESAKKAYERVKDDSNVSNADKEMYRRWYEQSRKEFAGLK